MIWISSPIYIVVLSLVSSSGGRVTRFCRGCVWGVFLVFPFALLPPAHDLNSLTNELSYPWLVALLCSSSSEGPMTLREVGPTSGPPKEGAASIRELPGIGTTTTFARAAKCEGITVVGAGVATPVKSLVEVILRGCEPRSGCACACCLPRQLLSQFLGLIIVMGDDLSVFLGMIIATGDDHSFVPLIFAIALIADLTTGRRAVSTIPLRNSAGRCQFLGQVFVVQSFAVSVLRHLGMRVLKRLRILRGSVEISDTSNSILRPLPTLPTCLTLTSTMTDAHCIRVVHWVVVIDDRTERAALPLASGSSAIR